MRETRGDNLLPLTMGPVVILIDGVMQRVIHSMRENEVMVFPSDEAKVVSKIYRHAIDAGKLLGSC